MDVIGRMYEHGERFWKANPHPTWVRLDGVTYHKTGIAPREMDPEVVPATARGAVEALREVVRRGHGQRAPLEWVALPAVDALKAMGVELPTTGGQS